MTDLVQVETALRLVGERQLLRAEWSRGHWSGALNEVAAALVLLCELPPQTAESVVDDYGLALSLRGHGPPPQFRAHHQAARRQATPVPALSPPVVVGCAATVDLPHGLAHIGSVVFTDDACQIAVRYDTAPTWSRRGRHLFGGGAGMAGRAQLTVTDDRGTRSDAHFSGGGSDAGWQGRWTTERPLSPTTRWLDLNGTWVDLGQGSAPCPVRVEALPDEPLVHRYLWHRTAAPRLGPPQDHDDVVEVLVDLGVIGRDDPILEELAQAAAARHGNSFGGAAPHNARVRWQRRSPSRPRSDGPVGDVHVAAATPEFDGTIVVVYGMRSEAHEFNIQARVVGAFAAAPGPFHDDLPGIPLAWWAEDDRDNTYLGQWGSHGGSSGDISGELRFSPPLDPKARRLAIMPTGLSHRAVIDVTLPEWGGAT